MEFKASPARNLREEPSDIVHIPSSVRMAPLPPTGRPVRAHSEVQAKGTGWSPN
jgi:hypothetical protein